MLKKREIERYDRQMIIPNFGTEGQEKLKKTKVTIAGVGGLGSVVSIYLTVAGIGHLKIIDDDIVEISNLNRQILHGANDIDNSKAKSAKEKLSRLNPDTEVTGVKEKITENNVLELLKNTDAIVDCMDNFHTRYLLNEAAIKMGMPLFHGACRGMEGQITTIIPGKTPCLRCIFPRAPPEEKFPILGAVSGTIGTIQATEVIKFFVGMEPLLTDRLLIYDAQFLTYDQIEIKRNPKCPSCGGFNEGEG